MNKTYRLVLLAVWVNVWVFAQTPSASALTQANYLENPRQYLASLDSAKLQSDILIDRVPYDSVTLNVNGYNKVTTIEYPNWYQLYKQIKFAHRDTGYLHPFNTLLRYSSSLEQRDNINAIGLIDYTFKRIKPEALHSGKFIEEEEKLNDTNADSSSYSTERVVAATCFSHNIFGDDINFQFKKFFFISNHYSEKLLSIAVDFGNGEGFKNVLLEEVVPVHYSSASAYIEIKVKLEYQNPATEEIKEVYAHYSVYRQSSAGIPIPSKMGGGKRASEPPPADLYYYPSLQEKIEYTDYCYTINEFGNKVSVPCNYSDPSVIFDYTEVWHHIPLPQYTIEYCYLFAPSNKSGKLRRPLVMCDGFDPGDSRDYKKTTKKNPDKLLPYEQDFRGLYQYLNGDAGSWYPGTPDANLAIDLQNEGYDLIIVNFLYGDGDVNENANLMRGFLNYLNSPSFRDNKTEEMILVGPSMGGLITRIALTEMERSGEEHYVKSWVSFDSPQKGANITLALQHAIDFATAFLPWNDPFDKKKEILNSSAAKQLLLEHFSATEEHGKLSFSYPHPMHTAMQTQLNTLGFPQISKNYSITNGGTKLLYDGPKQILDFSLDFTRVSSMMGWGGNSQNSGALTFKGSRRFWLNDKEMSFAYSIPYDNCPGGWTDAAYSINFHKYNFAGAFDEEDGIIEQKWATFIPTSSAFGVIGNTVEEKRVLANLTWESFTNCNDNTSGLIKTPFDGIYGITGENQQHMTITEQTKKDIQKFWFKPDLANATRPVVRTGAAINQTASKPVAYVVEETIKFGGNGNTFTFENGADANIVAGQEISFLPGFSTKSGATMHAKIKPGTAAILTAAPPQTGQTRSASFITRKKEDQSEKGSVLESPYLEKTYDYSRSTNGIPKEIESPLAISVYPNPTKDFVNINVKGLNSQSSILEVQNTLGEIVFSETVNLDGAYVLDMTDFPSGIYYLKVNGSTAVKQIKIVKL